jgi:hypothetical protein
MLGEQIGQESGQTTGMRVLPGDGAGGVKVEVSFQHTGTLLGILGSTIGTYVSETRPDGSLYGEGQGAFMTEDGEVAAWKGSGVGQFTGQGTAVSWRGAIYFQTTSERLGRLNGIAALFENDIDESGKSEDRTYEWK